jgi:transcription elongation factor Elf1
MVGVKLIPNNITELMFFPCPFCGEEPNVFEVEAEDGKAYVVECKQMGCMFGKSRPDYSLSHLNKVWNERPAVVADR